MTPAPGGQAAKGNLQRGYGQLSHPRNGNHSDTASALLRYRELRIGNYLPMAISLLEDM
jgi:hypothetical protein